MRDLQGAQSIHGARIEKARQRRAGQKFHGEVRPVVGQNPEVSDVDGVGVVDLGGETRLLEELLLSLLLL